MTMHRPLSAFLADRPAILKRGPLAVILVEDDAVVVETLRHHVQCGFRHVLALSTDPLGIPTDLAPSVTNLHWDMGNPLAHQGAMNTIIPAVPAGTWLYYAYNAEFLYFPFSETRSIGEMLAFHAEERRDAMLTYVIDLYASDLAQAPDGVSLTDAMFDSTGYFALARPGADGTPIERQLDFHGGLHWRFEEHIPRQNQRIDRIALFRSSKDLRMNTDHRFNIPEYNTYACAWHNNLTAAIASFRAAKALAANPGSGDEIVTMAWQGSRRFQWRAGQLMEAGLIEPGQWF